MLTYATRGWAQTKRFQRVRFTLQKRRQKRHSGLRLRPGPARSVFSRPRRQPIKRGVMLGPSPQAQKPDRRTTLYGAMTFSAAATRDGVGCNNEVATHLSVLLLAGDAEAAEAADEKGGQRQPRGDGDSLVDGHADIYVLDAGHGARERGTEGNIETRVRKGGMRGRWSGTCGSKQARTKKGISH